MFHRQINVLLIKGNLKVTRCTPASLIISLMYVKLYVIHMRFGMVENICEQSTLLMDEVLIFAQIPNSWAHDIL